MTGVTRNQDQDSADLSDEQLPRELPKRAKAGGMKLTGEVACQCG